MLRLPDSYKTKADAKHKLHWLYSISAWRCVSIGLNTSSQCERMRFIWVQIPLKYPHKASSTVLLQVKLW